MDQARSLQDAPPADRAMIRRFPGRAAGRSRVEIVAVAAC
jgi:hypothetical protein